MFPPAYSPLASEAGRRLPHCAPISWHAEEVNPFDTPTRPSIDVPPSETFHDDDLFAPNYFVGLSPTQPASRSPFVTARTFPTYNYDPWSAIRCSQAFEPPNHTLSTELPTDHDTIDTHALTFRLRAPFVYASKTSILPQYQIAQILDRQGKASSLKIRRLRPCETRACSVPALHAMRAPKIQYDDEETIFTMSGNEMSGHDDLAGIIQITSGQTLWGGSWTKVWHINKPLPSRRDSYKSPRRPRSFQGDKLLLYTIKKGTWEDADGTVVAREGKDKVLELGGRWASLRERKDLLVGCWVLKDWGEEGDGWDAGANG